MNIVIAIPTYNENKNIGILISKIRSLNSKYKLDILIIDDNSPDGTSETINYIQQNDKRLHLIKRKAKLGLGSAYCEAFKWAINHNFNFLIQMDADLSHNPDDILEFLNDMNDKTLLIGSRYKTGVNVVNWPLQRLILSYLANLYARFITAELSID